MKRILLTGSTGHLGSRTLNLLRSKYEVHAVVRKYPAISVEGVIFYEIDLSTPFSAEGLPAHMDAIVHLAQSRNYREFPNYAMEMFHVNTATTAVLLDYGRRVGTSHFILASTGGLYRPAEQVIVEETPIDPPEGVLAYYFKTKLAAEFIARSYSTVMNVNVLRPFFIYGPGQTNERLIGRLIESVRNGRKIQLVGFNGLHCNPIHVDDAAELITVMLDQTGSRIVNVAGPDKVSIRQIAESVGRLIHRIPTFEIVTGVAHSILADHSTVSMLLKRDLYGFEAGLKTIIK